MNSNALVRYGIVAFIVVMLGALFVVREVLPDEEDEFGLVAGVGPAEVGAVAPDFELAAVRGEDPIRLSDLRGQTVVLNFWATWCIPCRTEMPDLQAADDATDDVTVLAVNVQEGETRVVDFLDEVSLTLPVALDSSGDVREHYGVVGLPATFFIGPDGVIRQRVFGPITGDILPAGIEAAQSGASGG